VRANDAKRRRAVAVYDARKQHPRAETSSRLNGVSHRGYKLEFVSDVAASRDSGGEIDRAPFHLLEMGVHFPQTRKHGLAFRIHDGCAGWNFDSLARAGRDDAVILDDDNGIVDRRTSGSVDERRTYNRERAFARRTDSL